MAQCWVYDGHIAKNGYGKTSTGGRTGVLVHRVAYEALVGPIPEGLQLDHLCRNRACYNPTHLEPVTCAENLRRGESGEAGAAFQRAKTHCPAGHAFDAENTYRPPSGQRVCRVCRREAGRRYARRLSST